MDSKVYYMDARSNSPQTSMVAKMLAVFEAAGFDKIIKPGDIVAVKLHCGEWNNTAYLRPVYARTLVDKVKSLGGRPFVCDTVTLPYSPYPSRSTGLDFMVTAERNGYNSATLGCPFIFADGFMGTDDYRIDIPEGFLLKEAYIAEAIAAADVLLTLSHFKGHGTGVIGGAIKNLGIGAQSRRGKFSVHMGGHPAYGFGAFAFHPDKFKGKKNDENWRELIECCPFDLIHIIGDKVTWESAKCTNCMACAGALFSRGLVDLTAENLEATDAAIADGCLAAVKAVGAAKVAFINLAIDITNLCDCTGFADVPILPDLGVFASFDPVALDKACVDKAKKTAGIQGSKAEEKHALECGTRKFEACSAGWPGMSEEIQLNVGEINGLGSRKYKLIPVTEKKLKDVAFPPDSRPAGIRFQHLYKKLRPFPYDRCEGKGFMREGEVDLKSVDTYQEQSKRPSRSKSTKKH